MLKLVNDKFLIADDTFHQIADRDQSNPFSCSMTLKRFDRTAVQTDHIDPDHTQSRQTGYFARSIGS
jgi:hypothetical protein